MKSHGLSNVALSTSFSSPSLAMWEVAWDSPWLQTPNFNSQQILNKSIFAGGIFGSLLV